MGLVAGGVLRSPLGSLEPVKPRRSQPSTPLYNAVFVAALAFVLPVLVGLLTGNMDGREFGWVVLVTAIAFVATFAVSRMAQARHQH